MANPSPLMSVSSAVGGSVEPISEIILPEMRILVVVPLDFKAQDTSLQVRLYPESAEILLDVALKDYKTINEDMFAAEVRYDGDVTKNMLPVQISKFPSNVRIKKIKPEQIQYVIIK